jgi:ribulose 1,5-bisphosphate synthetase/thiazole synthase
MSSEDQQSSSLSTISLDEVSAQQYDVVVVGAGPAGTLAARELARLGRKVLWSTGLDFLAGKCAGAASTV